MMYVHGEKAKIPGDVEHNRVVDVLTRLEDWYKPILAGFAIFWLLWAIAAVGAVWYFIL
jgi:hypothetical protein